KFPAEPNFWSLPPRSRSFFWGFGKTNRAVPFRSRRLCLIRSMRLPNPALLPEKRPDLEFHSCASLAALIALRRDHTRQIGSQNGASATRGALTLAAVYRILQFRAAPRRVALSEGSIYAHPGDRENLAQRKMDQLGRRQVARPLARGELRLFGLRGHPLL